MQLIAFLSLFAFASVPLNGLCSERGQTFENYAFDPHAFYHTNSIIISKGNKILYERYAPGFKAENPQKIWSISKGILSLLVGISESEGKLKRDDLVASYLPQFKDSNTKISDLLHLSSGLNWDEGSSNPFKSNIIELLYFRKTETILDYLLRFTSVHRPGSHFRYSSGDTNLLSAVLRSALGPKDYANYPWRKLFEPLEIESATFESDDTGLFIASSYLYLSARDLLKIGQLILNKGQWNGKTVVPKEWIQYIATPAPSTLTGETKESYGAHWWLNRPAGDIKTTPFQKLPTDMILGRGHQGQYLGIFPSLNIVVARTGIDKYWNRLDINEFFSKALESARD